MKAALQLDALPREARIRRHPGSRQRIFQIRRALDEIDATVRASPQGPGLDRELDAFRRARSAQLRQDRQLAQAGNLQDIFQRPIRGLQDLQRPLHAGGVEL